MPWLRVAIAIIVVAGCAAPPPPLASSAAAIAPTSATPAPTTSSSAAPDLPGAKLFATLGCITCHSVTGELRVGPRLDGWFGRTIELNDGSTVVAEDAYFRESLRAPMVKVRAGYSPVMPVWATLSEGEVAALVAYIKAQPGAGCARFKDNYMAAVQQKEHRCVRDILLPKLSAGTLSPIEAPFLRDACAAVGDVDCEARAEKKM